jgi:hypothetical protein
MRRSALGETDDADALAVDAGVAASAFNAANSSASMSLLVTVDWSRTSR